MWAEIWPPHHVQELRQQEMQIDRQLPLDGGKTATLMRLTRDEAVANPYARFCGYFFPAKPGFAFSSGEQRLVEYALLEASDEEAAKELHATFETMICLPSAVHVVES